MGKNTNTPVVTLVIELVQCGLNYAPGACTTLVQGDLGYPPEVLWDQGNSSSTALAYYHARTFKISS